MGLRVPHEMLGGDAAALSDFVAQVEATGIDRVCVGDHVTFQGGQGFDGLVHATALAVLSRRLTVETAVYLLPLRHPVPVAQARLATAMEEFYCVAFGKFERYCPCGTPEDVAAGLQPYLDAGCRSFNLIPVAGSPQAAVEGVAAVRALLCGGNR